MNLCCNNHSTDIQQKSIELQLFQLYKQILSIKLTKDIPTLMNTFEKYDGIYCDCTYIYGQFFKDEDQRKDFDHYLTSFYTIENNIFELSYTNVYMFWCTNDNVCKCTRLFTLIIPCIIFYRCDFFMKETNDEYYKYYIDFLETMKTIVEICIKSEVQEKSENTSINNNNRCPVYSLYFKELIKNVRNIEKLRDQYKDIVKNETLDNLNKKYNTNIKSIKNNKN